MRRSLAPVDYDMFSNTFDELFSCHSVPATDEELKKYSFSWRKPRLVVLESSKDKPSIPEPTGAQIEALYQLRKAREEGIDKGLVVAATGVGKTYLSAFDSQEYKRILYVAHREEILRQAAETLLPFAKCKADFIWAAKDENADILFATVQTLARSLTCRLSPILDYILLMNSTMRLQTAMSR